MLPEGLRDRVSALAVWLLSGRKFDYSAQHADEMSGVLPSARACCHALQSDMMLNTFVGRDQEHLREQSGVGGRN